MEQAGLAALGTVFVVALQVRQQAGQQEVQVKGGLQAMAWEALQEADQASRGAHLRVLEEACWALPYLY